MKTYGRLSTTNMALQDRNKAHNLNNCSPSEIKMYGVGTTTGKI
jgi:hypothetical protein